jgi:hypothetical protein
MTSEVILTGLPYEFKRTAAEYGKFLLFVLLVMTDLIYDDRAGKDQDGILIIGDLDPHRYRSRIAIVPGIPDAARPEGTDGW